MEPSGYLYASATLSLGKWPTVTGWKITWALGTVQALARVKNIQPLTRKVSGPFITAYSLIQTHNNIAWAAKANCMYLPTKSSDISQQDHRQTTGFNNYQQTIRSSRPSNHSATLQNQYIIHDQIQISLIDYSGLTSEFFVTWDISRCIAH